MSLMSLPNLKKYRTRTFIETGTQYGEGIKKALQAGFTSIHSIEVDEELFTKAKEMFKGEKIVHLHLEKSQERLPTLLRQLSHRATFWLDAHGEFDSPLFLELAAIKKHPIKDHIIIIDDVRLFRRYGFTLDAIQAYTKTINKDYEFFYEDGIHPHL